MKWLLLLTILSGYSGPSTVTANFDSKIICEAAPKSQRSGGTWAIDPAPHACDLRPHPASGPKNPVQRELGALLETGLRT